MAGFLNPSEVLKNLKLKPDMVAADFGCGSGGWVLPLAKILEDGQVFAIDLLEEPLSALRSKAKTEKINNIMTIKSDVEKISRMGSSSCDLVLMTNLLFQCEDKKAVLEEGKRIMKKGAKLLVVDWKNDSALGPSETRVSADEIKKAAEESGFEIASEFEASSFHWGLILAK